MNERGGILLKIVVLIALLSAIAFQAGAIIVAKIQVDGVAVNAAEDAALDYGKHASTARAREVADRVATDGGATVTAFTIDRRRHVVVVTVEKRALAFLIDKIAALRKYTVETATHRATIR